MKPSKNNFNQKQLVFQELFIGTLVYAVVLGFFNDYTNIVEAKSFSTIFFASVVLEVLTFLAFLLKKRAVHTLKARQGAFYRFLLFFSVWLIMFLSKFVFIFSLDLLFGEYIRVNGFFGILLVVACVTMLHKLAYVIFRKLGDHATADLPE